MVNKAVQRREDGQKMMGITNKAIAYCRCSTDMQEMSIPDQKKDINAFAVKNGLEVIRYFEDKGKSGRYAEERPSFMRMIEHVKTCKDFKYVLVYDVSRWGRFINPEEATYWEVLIRKQGKQVLYITEGFKNDGHIGDNIMKLVKNSEATEYAMKLSKTSFRGHKSWAEKGYFVGGSPKYGFDRALYDEHNEFVTVLKDGEHKATKTQHIKLVVNPEQARIVRMIFDMKTEKKMGYRSIANELNEKGIKSPKGGKWSSSTLYYMLTDTIYTGELVYNKQKVDNLHEQDNNWGRCKPKSKWIICENAHEAIISKEQFEKVKTTSGRGFNVNGKLNGRGKSYKTPYLLSGGMIKCKSCGHNYQGFANRSHGNENFYYVCGGYHMKGKSVCKLFYVPKDRVENYAINAIEKRARSSRWHNRIEKELRAMLDKGRGKTNGRAVLVENELKSITSKIDNLLESIENGLDKNIAVDRIKALQVRKESLQREYEEATSEEKAAKSVLDLSDRVSTYVAEFKNTFKKGTVELRRHILSKFMMPVMVDNKNKTLQYNFLKVPMEQGYLLPLSSIRTLPTIKF